MWHIPWIATMVTLITGSPEPSMKDESVTADVVLERYERFVAGLRDLSFNCESIQKERGNVFRDWTWIGTTWSTFVKRGDRWRFRNREVSVDHFEGRIIPSDTEVEYVYNEGKLFKIFHDYREVRTPRGRFDESDVFERFSNDSDSFEMSVRVLVHHCFCKFPVAGRGAAAGDARR